MSFLYLDLQPCLLNTARLSEATQCLYIYPWAIVCLTIIQSLTQALMLFDRLFLLTSLCVGGVDR